MSAGCDYSREHVVLDDAQTVLKEVADLRLRAAAAVHHAMDLAPRDGIQDCLHNRRVRPRRAQDELSDGEASLRLDIGQVVLAAVDEVGRHGGVVALGVLLGKGLVEDVMPR